MKTVKIYSHKNDLGDKSKKTQNGDIYDSKVEVYDENKNLLFSSNNVNVDSSKNILPAQVELADGIYCGILGVHNGRINAFFICDKKYQNDLEKAGDWKVLLDDTFIEKHPGIRFLPSKYPNPNWNGQYKVNGCNYHDGGDNYDWSSGCISNYYKDHKEFLKFFKLNEVVIIEKV